MNRLMMVIVLFIFGLVSLNGVMTSLYGKMGDEKSGNSTEFRSQLSKALQVYFELENAIFEGNTKISAEKATTLSKVVSNIEAESLGKEKLSSWGEVSQQLQTAAGNLVSKEDIAEQRSAFFEVSNAMLDMVKNYGPLNVDAFLYHCPMALKSGAQWLSASKDVANPYLGEKMATCGTLVESFSVQN